MQLNNLFAALSCWFMAAGALMAWWWPQYLGAGAWLDYLGAIVLIEFLVLHSTGMLAGVLMMYHEKSGQMGDRLRKRLVTAGLVALVGFYLLLAYGVSSEVKSTTLFIGFSALMLSRAAGFFITIERHELIRDLYRSFFSLGLFIPGIFVAWLVPFPAGAVQGRWVGEMPAEGVLAVIVIYFFLLGLFEYKAPHKIADQSMQRPRGIAKDSFVFEELASSRPLEITTSLQAQIQSIAEDSITEDVGVTFTITRAVLSNGIPYVEITPDKFTGSEKYVFELYADHSVNRCYDLDGDRYTLLFD